MGLAIVCIRTAEILCVVRNEAKSYAWLLCCNQFPVSLDGSVATSNLPVGDASLGGCQDLRPPARTRC